MRESYADAITDASDVLIQVILANEEDMPGRIRLLDGLIRDLLRCTCRVAARRHATAPVRPVTRLR